VENGYLLKIFGKTVVKKMDMQMNVKFVVHLQKKIDIIFIKRMQKEEIYVLNCLKRNFIK
jgi:hypothetical protein